MRRPPKGRMLRENILDSKKLGLATHAACNLWFRLLVKVDDFGNFPDQPSMIRSVCFLWRRKMKTSFVQELIDELAALGLLSRYQVNGEPFLHFERFDDFQQMRYEKVSKFPRLELPSGTEDYLLQRSNVGVIAATGDSESPLAVERPHHAQLTPAKSPKEGVKLSKRSKEKESAALPQCELWKELGVRPDRLDPELRELLDGLYQTRGDQSLATVVGIALDLWEERGKAIPPKIARAIADVRDREKNAAKVPVAELPDLGSEAIAWQHK